MKRPRRKTPQLGVRCKRCRRVFVRYDYGVGRRRFRRWGKSKGNPYVSSPFAKVTDPCIFCRGAVEVLTVQQA